MIANHDASISLGAPGFANTVAAADDCLFSGGTIGFPVYCLIDASHFGETP